MLTRCRKGISAGRAVKYVFSCVALWRLQEWSAAEAARESDFEQRLLQERERKRKLRMEQQLQVRATGKAIRPALRDVLCCF